MSGSSVPVGRPRPAAILSPVIDLLCVGGLSLIVFVPLLLSGRGELDFVSIAALAWAQALVNYLHFMASYRMVYRDREMIRRHQWATIWVPLILLGFLIIALLTVEQSQILLIAFFAVASGYLAWHYTGQAWGMMASYAFLDGIRFEKTERLLIRTSLRILLAWHVIWFLHTALSDPTRVELVYRVISAATVPAFVLGIVGLSMVRRRTGRLPPARALVAWFAMFVWYAAMARWGLPALFLVQLFHALQYLEFPVRVELNRATREAPGRAFGRLLSYAAILVTASILVILVVPGPAMSIAANLFGAPENTAAPILILYFINIHHYFTDGVIWKLSNPEVRKELFAHVTPAGAGAPAAAAPGGRKGKKRKGAKG
jgi:hypothetical protein